MKTSFVVAAWLITQAAWAVSPADQNEYAHAQTRVDIGGGRKMNLYCMGSGSPTVVFESGTGSAGWDWLLVQPVIAQKTRACSYDRAGLGFSDASGRLGTSANAVDDLHRLLTAADVKPPYVLVGHSYGGMTVQLYAYTHPQEVVGLVSVDGGHEDEPARLDRITGGIYSKLMAQYLGVSKRCAAGAAHDMSPGTEAYKECVGEPPPVFKGPVAHAYQSMKMSAVYWQATLSEEESEMVSATQLRNARKSFGALPLIYLTRGVSPYLVAGKPQSPLNKAAEQDVKAMHDEITALSTRGSNRVVAGAGHYIHMEKPKAVIDATLDVLAQARGTPRAP